MTVTETRPEASTDATEATAPARVPSGGLAGLLGSGDHKTIGRLYIVTSLLFLLVAGVAGALVGAERIDVDRLDVLGQESFAQVFTLHTVSAVFLFLVPFLLGLAMVVVPLQVGASTVAFPRAAAVSYWTFLVSGGILLASYGINGGPFGGDANGVDMFISSFAGVLVSLVLGSVCVVTTVLALRPAGMTLDRVPMFSWSMVVTGSIWLLSLPVLFSGLVLAYVDTHYGVGRFGGSGGMYSSLMRWAFQQPQLYAFAVPALGIALDTAATFSGVRLGLRQRQAGMVAIGLAGAIGFGAWAQRGLVDRLSDQALYVIDAFAILLPFLVVTALVGDALRRGRPKLASPLVFSIGALVMLLAGAAAGATSAIDPLDLLYPDTTWTTAQAHYVLLGVTLAAVGGVHYWATKLFGQPLREGLGVLTAVVLFAGTVVLSLPDLVSGLLDQFAFAGAIGIVRDNVETMNLISFVGGIVVVVGVLLLLFNLVGSLLGGRDAEVSADPWGGQTLEWATASPPPVGNFTETPVVTSAEPLLDLVSAEGES